MSTWYLIADGSRARIFARDDDTNISLVETFDHPEGRMHAGDLSMDVGRTRQTGSAVFASAKEERNARRDQENANFAKTLVDYLAKGLPENKIDEWVLVAGPQFLGLIREKLTPAVEKLLTATLPKDLTELSPHELKKRDDVFELHSNVR